jgi:hypothetical protein
VQSPSAIVERHHVLGLSGDDISPLPVRTVDDPGLVRGHFGSKPSLIVSRSLDPVRQPSDLVVNVVARQPENRADQVCRGRLPRTGDSVHEDPPRAPEVFGGR